MIDRKPNETYYRDLEIYYRYNPISNRIQYFISNVYTSENRKFIWKDFTSEIDKKTAVNMIKKYNLNILEYKDTWCEPDYSLDLLL